MLLCEKDDSVGLGSDGSGFSYHDARELLLAVDVAISGPANRWYNVRCEGSPVSQGSGGSPAAGRFGEFIDAGRSVD